MGFVELWQQKWEHTISRTHSSNKNTKQKWETKEKSTSLLNRVSQVQPMINGGVPPIKEEHLYLTTKDK